MDISCQAWRPLAVDSDSNYFIRTLSTDDKKSFVCQVTDCSSCWTEEPNSENVRKRIKSLNPILDVKVENFLSHVWKELDYGKKLTLEFQPGTKVNENLKLTLNTEMADCPIVWCFNCKQAAENMISEILTVPLMIMVSELLRRQSLLQKLLHEKDQEIEDYKSQGVKPQRRFLETQKFNADTFEDRMTTSQEFQKNVIDFGGSCFTNEGKKLYSSIMMKNRSLLQDSSEDKASSRRWKKKAFVNIPVSPVKTKSPVKAEKASPVKVVTKEEEAERRQNLNQKLANEEAKKDVVARKKKKLKL